MEQPAPASTATLQTRLRDAELGKLKDLDTLLSGDKILAKYQESSHLSIVERVERNRSARCGP
jgi:hypothetical protein